MSEAEQSERRKDGDAPASTGALIKRFWSDCLRPLSGMIMVTTVLAAFTAAAATSYAFVMQWTFQMLEAQDMRVVTIAPAAIIAMVLVRSGFMFVQNLQTNRLALKVMQDLQDRMFTRLVRADFARLAAEPVGAWVSRFTNDINILREALVRAANNLLRDSLTIIGAVFAMFWLDWQLALLVLIVYPLAALPVERIGRMLRSTSTEAQLQMGELTTFLDEDFSGARMVKTYGLEDYETARANRLFDKRYRLQVKLAGGKATVDPILEVFGGLAIAGVMAFAGWRISSGDSSIANLMGFVTAVGVMAPSARALGTLNAVVQEALAVLQRVFDVVDWENRVTAALDAPDLRADRGGIRLKDVRFSYDAGENALEDVDIDIAPGQTVALVGPSGAGKSTVLNLIPRLYDPDAGSIEIDGQDIRGVSLASLRRAIALVSQDVVLFDDTVRANIGFGRLDASEDEIIEAAKAADAHDFIMALPEGYDSPVGERGENLSGGQRQRVSIARAILKDAPILLLDEATSALDTQSERRVQSALERLSEGRTRLVIAHRLSTVREADRIFVMESGRVVEQGRHDELMAKDGLYAQLCALQFGKTETADGPD